MRFGCRATRCATLSAATDAEDLEREYALLRALRERQLPVVEPVGLVTDRPAAPGQDRVGDQTVQAMHSSE